MSNAPAARPPSTRESDRPGDQSAGQTRNLWVLIWYTVALRCGWIFKTESVVMPAVVDVLAGSVGAAGWIRGMLPLLNKFGQSVPPLLFADLVRRQPLKKWPLVTTSGLMAFSFAAIAVLWATRGLLPTSATIGVFLALYATFFAAVGLNGMAFNTVQGKLVPANRRGRLLGVGAIVGSLLAVGLAWTVMPTWLEWPSATGFVPIFFTSAAGYAVGAACCIALREERSTPATSGKRRPFRDVYELYRNDRWFRRTAWVAALASSSQILFPHYQWIGRELLGAELGSLFWWVMAQNLTVAIVGPLAGRLGDVFGNRLALRTMVALSLLPPVFAGALLWLFRSGYTDAAGWFWIVFCLLGLTPVTVRTLMNYTLELTSPENHPRYLASVQACFAIPFLLSPIAGGLVDATEDRGAGVSLLIGILSSLLLVAFVLTFRLREMRAVSGS